MVSTLSDLSYWLIIAYTAIFGGFIVALVFFSGALLLFLKFVKFEIIKYIYRRVLTKKNDLEASPDLDNPKTLNVKRKLNWYKRLGLLILEFMELVTIGIICAGILVCILKAFIKNDDFIFYIITFLAIVAGDAIGTYFTKTQRKINYLFDEKVKIGQRITFYKIEGIVVDIKQRFVIMKTEDEKQVIFPLKQLNEKPVIIHNN